MQAAYSHQSLRDLLQSPVAALPAKRQRRTKSKGQSAEALPADSEDEMTLAMLPKRQDKTQHTARKAAKKVTVAQGSKRRRSVIGARQEPAYADSSKPGKSSSNVVSALSAVVTTSKQYVHMRSQFLLCDCLQIKQVGGAATVAASGSSGGQPPAATRSAQPQQPAAAQANLKVLQHAGSKRENSTGTVTSSTSQWSKRSKIARHAEQAAQRTDSSGQSSSDDDDDALDTLLLVHTMEHAEEQGEEEWCEEDGWRELRDRRFTSAAAFMPKHKGTRQRHYPKVSTEHAVQRFIFEPLQGMAELHVHRRELDAILSLLDEPQSEAAAHVLFLRGTQQLSCLRIPTLTTRCVSAMYGDVAW